MLLMAHAPCIAQVSLNDRLSGVSFKKYPISGRDRDQAMDYYEWKMAVGEVGGAELQL
jgi:hypothetical protein